MRKLLTLLITVTILFIFTTATLAATSVEGTLLYRVDGDDNGTKNRSDVDFFRLQISTDKSFNDDKGYAYLAVHCQTYLPEPDNPDEHEFNWQIRKYGYNYSINDRWEAGITYDTEGVTLSDGLLATDWDWRHISLFDKMNALKLVGSPLDTTKIGLYFEPESEAYLVKGLYKKGRLKIGAGFGDNGLQQYNVFTEILPTEKSKIYLDYYSDENQKEIGDGIYILEASAGFDPITVNVLWSNEEKDFFRLNIVKHKANTADISVNYALSPQTSITGGVWYETNYSDLDAYYVTYNFNKGFVGVKQDSPTIYDQLTDTHINWGFRIDGTNLLEADYNVTTNAWWFALAIWL